jgi:MFS family permease
MCENVFGVPQKWVGAATGLITGAFSFAQFLSGFSLGHASDHFGRKPLLLMGSFTAALGVFFFGMSPLLSVAVLNRFVCGIFNNNMASGKAFIGDVSSGEGRALAFAYQGACFSLARALASVIAALTTGSSHPHPSNQKRKKEKKNEKRTEKKNERRSVPGWRSCL